MQTVINMHSDHENDVYYIALKCDTGNQLTMIACKEDSTSESKWIEHCCF